MDSDKINRWLTLGANFGVLIGLILLITEIRQTSLIAELQFDGDYYSAQVQVDELMTTKEAAEAWSKSVIDPESLSVADIKILDSYLATRLSVWRRAYDQEQSGFVPAGTAEESMRVSAGIYFGSKFAQAWWELEKQNGWLVDEFGKMVDEILTGLSPTMNAEWIENLQNNIREF